VTAKRLECSFELICQRFKHNLPCIIS
jgi:hypothetical protein